MSIIWVLIVLNGLTFFPLIFNWFIIPEIEKKVGKKLEYRLWIYKGRWFPKLSYYLEIAAYIVILYLRKKIGRPLLKKRLPPEVALINAKYEIEMVSRKELMWSFFTVINGILFFLICFLLLFMDKVLDK